MPYKDPVIRAAYLKAYNERNRERVNAYGRTEKGRARSRRAYWNNRDKKIAGKRRYYAINKGRQREWGFSYRVKYADAIKARKQAYHVANRERLNAEAKERYKNPEVRARNRKRLRLAARLGIYSTSRALDRARRQSVKLRADSGAAIFIQRVRLKKSLPCYYCGKHIAGKAAHIDHIIAITKSGNHTSDNLCASCPECNMSKRTRSLSEWVPPNNQPVLNL